jgi:PmbA protein
MLSKDEARTVAERLVEHAVRAGADAADAIYVGSRSTEVQVRLGELDHVERSEDEEIGLRVFLGARPASVASSDLSTEAFDELVKRALAMAAEAPEDRFAGYAPPELLAAPPFAELDSFDSVEPDPSELRARALATEKAALGVEGVANSSGAGASESVATIALATSHGFGGSYHATGRGCSVSVVAGEGAGKQRDSWSHSTRHADDLEAPETIGREAGRRAVARLNPVRPKSGPMPVLFDPRVAGSLLGHFAGAIAGSSVARKSSFLQERLGERVFAEGVCIVDDPIRHRGLRSRPFDGEGMRVRRQDIVADGILQTWMADSASARQLGIEPTGHSSRSVGGAPGVSPSNFYLAAGERSREELLAAFPEALLVTELIGQGVNPVTGDYSRGAAGFLVRDGEIGPSVQEITIASNLIDMFATLEPGSDLEFRRGVDSPTILVPRMTVATA